MHTHQFHDYVDKQNRQLKLKWRVMEFKEEAVGTLCLDVYQDNCLQKRFDSYAEAFNYLENAGAFLTVFRKSPFC